MGSYNTTLLANLTNVLQMAQATNTLMNGAFAAMILASLWLITFFAIKLYDTRMGFFVASLFTTFVSMFMFFAGLIDTNIVIYPFVLLFFSLFGMMVGND